MRLCILTVTTTTLFQALFSMQLEQALFLHLASKVIVLISRLDPQKQQKILTDPIPDINLCKHLSELFPGHDCTPAEMRMSSKLYEHGNLVISNCHTQGAYRSHSITNDDKGLPQNRFYQLTPGAILYVLTRGTMQRTPNGELEFTPKDPTHAS